MVSQKTRFPVSLLNRIRRALNPIFGDKLARAPLSTDSEGRTVSSPPKTGKLSRRGLLGALTASAVGTTAAMTGVGSEDGRQTLQDALGSFFQEHFTRMGEVEIRETLERLQRRYEKKFDVKVRVGATAAIPGVLFGYALDISRCKGYRECVKACVEENNQSRDSEIQYIRVLELDQGTMNFEEANPYYDPETVPQAGKIYLPVQCHQCENPPCVAACPVEATWKEPDGIVVIDYDWCIGCRYCATACPYWARKFNFTEPTLPRAEINPETEYLSNRPREKGVMEKCTFCLQRTRKGRQPACQEACPTGARVFGNLLDPNSEINYILNNKKVFRLKEDLNTEPKFWYYSS